jgi:hypothetical protein
MLPHCDRVAWRSGALAAAVASVAFGVHGCIIEPYRWAQKGAEAKQNLHAVQLALERFAVDSEDAGYPVTTAALRTSGYLPKFPRNPYTGEEMREYPVDIERLPPGDFVYYPRTDSPGQPPTGYTLAIGEQGLSALRDSIQRRHERGY